MNEEHYYLAFSCSPGIGPKTFTTLLNYFQTAHVAWTANEEDVRQAGIGQKTYEKFDDFRKTFDISEYLGKLKKAKVTFVSRANKNYPQELFALPDPPIGIFVKGNISVIPNSFRNPNGILKQVQDDMKGNFPSIAIVGTRKITSYGTTVTEKLTAQLVSYGVTIVSGLAFGVDAEAHKTTLANNGTAIAVLGCGVDCPFPRENEHLYSEIIEHGGTIISEYPLGQEPNKGTFPARNRIIAALSQAVLIPEAAADSGSLITAEWAKRLEKKIFAVPGPITSSQSAGTLYLLQQGAKLIVKADDIIQELGLRNYGVRKKSIQLENLTHEERRILEIIEDEPLSLDALSKILKLPVFKLSPLISNLEIKGIIKKTGQGIFEIGV